MRKYVLLICLLFSMSVSVFAQGPAVVGTTQTPLLNSGHNYIESLSEIVDPGTGSLSIRIAAPAPHERGMNLPHYAFVYDTNGQPQNSITPSWFQPTDSNGIPDAAPRLEYLIWGATGEPLYLGAYYGAPNSISYQYSNQFYQTAAGVGNSLSCDYYSGFVYTDPDGGRHNLDIRTLGDSTPPQACSLFAITQYLQGGDEHYRATIGAGGPSSINVTDSHGNVLFLTVEDTNGNGPNGTGRAYAIQTGGASWLAEPMLTSTTIPGLGSPYSITYETTNINMQLEFTNTYASVSTSCSNQTVTSGSPGIPGNTETTVSISVPKSVILPDGQQYSFSYDPTFGFINEITYPTGATVAYTWSYIPQSQPADYSVTYPYAGGGGGPASCSYRSDWMGITKRVESIGGVPTLEQDFSYQTNWSGSTNVWTSKTTTVITKDLTRAGTPSFETAYTYLPGHQAGEQVIPFGFTLLEPTTLESTIQYYGWNAPPPAAPIRTITKTWFTSSLLSGECTTLDNGYTSGKFYQYEPAGELNGAVLLDPGETTDVKTDVAEFDYNQNVTSACQRPSSPAPRRETVTAYHSFAATPIFPAGPSIMDRPNSVQVYGNGTLLGETEYTYDGSSVAAASAIDHDETNYAAGSTAPRGNATSVTRECLQGCTNAVTQYGYDETGQVISAVDPNGNATAYSFADAYSSSDGSSSGSTNTYVSKITYPPLNGASQIKSFTYGFDDGNVRSSTDENRQTTTYCYLSSGCSGNPDPWARETEVQYPDGGISTVSYSDAGPNPYWITSTAINSATTEATETITDEMGRVVHTELTSDPNGTDFVDTTYDGLGNTASVSNPYRSTGDSTYGVTTYSHDPLNRMTSQINQDGSPESWAYSGNTVTFMDELSNSWVRTSDALGRLTNVVEPSGGTTAAYTYDALNDLTGVTQAGESRSFIYDSLSRLTSATNPESGTVSYGYDPNSNLITKQDGRGITTNYTYDPLNQLLPSLTAMGLSRIVINTAVMLQMGLGG